MPSKRGALELVDETREGAAPSPAPSPAPERVSAVDPAERLFEALQVLSSLESPSAAGQLCLEVAIEAVPCVAALLHLREPATRDLVIVQAHGPRADALLGARAAQVDPLVVRAVRTGTPTVVTYGTGPGEQPSCARHAHFDPWLVVLVPVVHGGQLLGLLELIDPIDGPIDDAAQGGLDYIAGCLGRFIAEHGA
jgi:hypothetical protein